MTGYRHIQYRHLFPTPFDWTFASPKLYKDQRIRCQKRAKPISDPRSLCIKATFNCEVLHASMPRKPVAIGRAVVYHAQAAYACNARIKYRHCRYYLYWIPTRHGLESFQALALLIIGLQILSKQSKWKCFMTCFSFFSQVYLSLKKIPTAKNKYVYGRYFGSFFVIHVQRIDTCLCYWHRKLMMICVK